MESIRTMKPKEWEEVGKLIYVATNTWYEQNGKSPVFSCEAADLRFFCEVYEGMDPGCCLVAEIDAQIAASCFYHPRPTHYSLGIMCVHPKFYGRGLAKKLLNEIIRLSSEANKPLNLISSAINLDSFSLYNKAGFAPISFYQDMIIPVPEEGFDFAINELACTRSATIADIPEMVKLEMDIHGQDHSKDFEYIINVSSGHWNCNVYEENGKILGFLCSVNHPSTKIIGLGAFRSESIALTLIKSHLNFYKAHSPLVIIPSSQRDLVKELLKLKARNVELHITQTIADNPTLPKNGFIIPTFMPE